MSRSDARLPFGPLSASRSSQRCGCGCEQYRRVFSSDELLGEDKELIIEHNGYQYSLRLTRQNKLILTK